MNQVGLAIGSAWCSTWTPSGDILEVSWSPDGKPLPPSLFVPSQPDGFPIYQDRIDAAGRQHQRALPRRRDGLLLAGQETAAAVTISAISGARRSFGGSNSAMSRPRPRFYGLGQYPGGVLDWRGHEVLLVQSNQGIAVPFLISTDRC